jgi:hypothetical protein
MVANILFLLYIRRKTAIIEIDNWIETRCHGTNMSFLLSRSQINRI